MNKIFNLKNGMRMAYTYDPNVHSVCWGVFVGVGSADETDATSGISHLIEHMCFKGTDTRSAFDIVRETEDLGANLNAFTTKEQTAYYIQCVDDSVERCVEILADIVLHRTFDKQELEREKEVVIEEIAMSEDTPDDLAGELAGEAFWGEDSLARPILGNKQNVSGFSREQLLSHVGRYYTAQNAVLSVVGNIDEGEAKRLAERYFGFPQGEVAHTYPVCERGHRQIFKQKDVEQCNVVLSFDGLARYHQDTYASMVLDAVLGGGMSSILFQRVREELGLVYSIYTYGSQYEGRGSFNIYLGTTPAKLPLAIKTVANVIEELKLSGITPEQLERGRNQSLSNYVFGLENNMAVMRVQARSLLYKSEPFDADTEIAKLKQVSLEDVNALAKRLFADTPAVGLVAKENMDCVGYFNGKQ